MLKLPAQKVAGHLSSERSAVILTPKSDPAESFLYLRFALVIQGVEWLLLPSFVLDDWGRERRKLSLLNWIYENGDYFPRAEIFGYMLKPGKKWKETQVFVRDLELMSRWPVFAYQVKNDPVDRGLRVHQAIVENPEAAARRPIERPENFGGPFIRADLTWYEAPPLIDTSSSAPP